jgi:hypothetical protein
MKVGSRCVALGNTKTRLHPIARPCAAWLRSPLRGITCERFEGRGEWRLDHPRRQGDERGNGRANGQAPLSLPPLKSFFGSHSFLLIVASKAEALGLARPEDYFGFPADARCLGIGRATEAAAAIRDE